MSAPGCRPYLPVTPSTRRRRTWRRMSHVFGRDWRRRSRARARGRIAFCLTGAWTSSLVLGRSDAPGERDDGVTEAIGVGAMTRPLLVTGHGPRLYIGVRFRPGCAFAALGIPASELTDEQVAYSVLARDANAELDALSALATNEERCLEADGVALVRRRLLGAITVPASVRAAVHRISAARGGIRVADLASSIGITQQQLARQFATHVGVTPKTFARVMRAHAGARAGRRSAGCVSARGGLERYRL